MRMFRIAAPIALIVSIALPVLAASPIVVLPGKEQWMKQQGGYSLAVLYGNPDTSGYCAVRLKTGANWTFPAHYHPNRENVTVISGVLYAGMGKKMDRTKMTAYPAGSFVSLPPGMVHYAMTKEPAVIEITGNGPLKNVMVK